MANLSYREKLLFEGLFGMDSGYVLDFSNSTFARFIAETINLDIYDGNGYQEYCSKANKLRQIWSKEPNAVVGKLMDELLSYYDDYHNRLEEPLSEQQNKTINELRTVTKKLMGTDITINLPHKSEETLQTLMEDINDSLARNKPTLVLDRLHTFATKLLRQACIDNDINVLDGKGNYLPLHSLAGMLKKKYEKDQIFESSFTLRALQNSISLFDSYNDIRNTKSYAHDNEILNSIEADFVVRAMANVITFIDKIETNRKKVEFQKQSKSDNVPIELPF